jgi:hypothetical protein
MVCENGALAAGGRAVNIGGLDVDLQNGRHLVVWGDITVAPIGVYFTDTDARLFARLFAASPDLAAELKAMVEHFGECAEGQAQTRTVANARKLLSALERP